MKTVELKIYILTLIPALLGLQLNSAFAAPADYGDLSSPKVAPYVEEMVTTAPRAAARISGLQNQNSGKISDMKNNRRHTYFDGASVGQFATLIADDIAKVGLQLSPFSSCMDYKLLGYCGHGWCIQVCAPILGCMDIYCADLPTGLYRQYYMPVAMADTTNVRGATAMQLATVNKPLVKTGQQIYETYAKSKMFVDPITRQSGLTLPELELERTWGAGVNAAALRGKGAGLSSKLDLAALASADINKIIDQRANIDNQLGTYSGSGNIQADGQGNVFATWQTPPGYPIGAALDVILKLLINKEPAIPIAPPIPFFTKPYPYPGAWAKLYDFCHCKRRPPATHFVGSEYPIPIINNFNPFALPNILARSNAIANWYTPNNSDFATKMTIQYGDPTTAINSDIANGVTDIAQGGVPTDMFTGLQRLGSGKYPGAYRGNQHGWINISNKVNQAANTGASEEAILKAFKFSHFLWPNEYYDVTPGKDGDKIQWTHGRLHDADWGDNSKCQFIGHYTKEFKRANETYDRDDVWNVGHLWKKVRCCDKDSPIVAPIWGHFPNPLIGNEGDSGGQNPPIEDRNSSSCPASGRTPF